MSVNIGGYYLIFRFQQHRVRKEIKLKIKLGVPEKDLCFITINPSNRDSVEWEHSREFKFRGTMYDVIRYKTIDETTVEYCCVNDHQEAILFANLDEEIQRSRQSGGKSKALASNLLKLLTIPFLVPAPGISFFSENPVPSFSLGGSQLCLLPAEVPSPPPKLG